MATSEEFAILKQGYLHKQHEDQNKSFTDTWIEDILPRPMPSDTKSVVALCFAGIPKELRGRVWGWLLGNKLQINEELFRICKDRAEAVRSEIALQKEVDAIMKLSAGPSTLATQSTNFSEDESDDAKVSPSTTRLSTPCLTTSENEDIDLSTEKVLRILPLYCPIFLHVSVVIKSCGQMF
ncbi:hypothetical protein ABG067_000529 [Albugo candida]